MSDDVTLEITNFHSLENYTKTSSLKFRESVIAYYKKLGEEKGFSVRENFSIIKNGANFGKLELLWLEPNIIFTTEFGNIEEIYKHLWKIMEYKPNLAVLILSSKAGCKADDVAKIIEKSNITGDKKNIFLLMDITERRIIRIS
jgi:hypothetical protein